MRSAFLAAFLTLWTGILTTSASAGPALDAETADMMRREALADRYPDRWQGRQHYLFDETNKRAPATYGSATGDGLECRDVPARVKRPDGSTTVSRFNKCD
jgi:hypothetical protein